MNNNELHYGICAKMLKGRQGLLDVQALYCHA